MLKITKRGIIMKSTNKGNFVKTVTVPTIVLLTVLALAACDNPTDNTGTEPEPGPISIGENQVGGKTMFTLADKIVFAPTAEGALRGAFKVEDVREESPDVPKLDENDKYIYDTSLTGTYTWNEDKKTVTLTPQKVALDAESGQMLDKNEAITMMLLMLKEFNISDIMINLITSGKYSSVSAVVRAMADEVFAVTTYSYISSEDDTALFMVEALPASRGRENELLGKTYNSFPDFDMQYTFTADAYTWVHIPSSTTMETGKYAYNSNTKEVWLQPLMNGGQTVLERYTTEELYGENPFESDIAYKAAHAGNSFERMHFSYDVEGKTLSLYNPFDFLLNFSPF